MKYLGPLLLLMLFLYACGTKQDKNNAEISNKWVTFEMLDSIRIDYLGSPTVHDLDPGSKKLIFMEHKEISQIINIADFDGSILASFSKWGDVPDSYGGLMASLRIVDYNSFVAYGTKGFLTYDFEGKHQSLVKHINSPYRGFGQIGLGSGMQESKGRYLYINQVPQSITKNEVNFYEKLRPLTWLDHETGENEPIIQFPENSIFRSGKYFFRNSWAPAFTLVDDLIYVAFGIEPVIYSYEASPPYSLVSSISLDLPDYRYFKGAATYSTTDVRFFGQARTSGKVLNIKKIDKYFVIAYFPGHDALDTEEAFTNKSPDEARAFYDKIHKKYPHRIAILDSLGRMVNDFVPEGLSPNSMVLRNGELWMMEKPDEEVEQDFFRLFRVGLKSIK